MPKPGGSALSDRSVTAKLTGFYKPGTAAYQFGDSGWMYEMFARGQAWRAIPKLLSWCVSGNVIATWKWMATEGHERTIHDARVLEAGEGLSKAEFFHKFGFVLLDHESRMSASDWLESGDAFLVDETEKSAEEQARHYMAADTPVRT